VLFGLWFVFPSLHLAAANPEVSGAVGGEHGALVVAATVALTALGVWSSVSCAAAPDHRLNPTPPDGPDRACYSAASSGPAPACGRLPVDGRRRKVPVGVASDATSGMTWRCWRVTQSTHPPRNLRSRSAAEVTRPRYQQTGGRPVTSSQKPQSANAAEALERLGRLSLHEMAMKGLLHTVADLAKTMMPGNPEASVTLLVKGHPTTMVSTGRLATDLDEAQYGCGHGPCLHAARTGELTEIADTRTDTRWVDYMPRAAEHGNLSSLSAPVTIDEAQQVSGALNIYAREPHAFDEDSRTASTGFALYVALATGNLLAYQGVRDRAEERQTASGTPAALDQATGILMERHKLTADQAAELLSQVSITTNRRLRTVADDLIRTGELAPSAGPPTPAS
jgi:ANTAR domain/GAF domain